MTYDYKSSLQLAFRQPMLRKALRHFAIVLGAFVAVAALVWGPTKYNEQVLKMQIRDTRMNVVAQLQAKEIEQAYRLARDTLAKYDPADAHPLKQADLISELASLARRNRLAIVRQSFEKKQTEDGITTLRQQLQVVGRYRNLKKFLYGLQSLSTWTMVREARIEKTGKRPGTVSAILLLATYRKGEA